MTDHPQFRLSIEHITHAPNQAAALKRWSHAARGLVLFAGRPGSGKTTTVYACMAEALTQGSPRIATVEDALDLRIAGVDHTCAPGPDEAHQQEAFEAIAGRGADVLFAGTGPALWKSALSKAQAGQLVFVQLEADSAAHAVEVFTAGTSQSALDHLVGSVWQALHAVPETGRRRAQYDLEAGPLDA